MISDSFHVVNSAPIKSLASPFSSVKSNTGWIIIWIVRLILHRSTGVHILKSINLLQIKIFLMSILLLMVQNEVPFLFRDDFSVAGLTLLTNHHVERSIIWKNPSGLISSLLNLGWEVLLIWRKHLRQWLIRDYTFFG